MHINFFAILESKLPFISSPLLEVFNRIVTSFRLKLQPFSTIFASPTPTDHVPFSPQTFTFKIFFSLVKMSDSPIHIASDSKSDVSSITRMRVPPDSNPFPLLMITCAMKLYPKPKPYNYDSEMVSRNSHDERAFSKASFDALLTKDDAQEDYTVVPMQPSFVYFNSTRH